MMDKELKNKMEDKEYEICKQACENTGCY